MSKPLRLKLKQKWLPFIYAYLGRAFLKVLGLTCRFRIEGAERFAKHAENNKCILMFWHNRITMATEILLRAAPQFNYAAMVSKSRDGEVIAVLTNSYRQARSIRVPHNARSKALQTVIQELENNDEIMIITPDGPRGPIYKVKPGIAIAAQKTGASVIPMSWSTNKYWELPTWDKLMLPKPFSTINVTLGEPISIQNEGKESLEKGINTLEEALLSLENKSH
ncbi:MAG: hypothetical protein K940chlam7_01735 [Chlamydiae bacterium]|nr:hypothetical protein [Chlamydiota bacterium]